ncbi:MAG: hypothetical protein ACRDVP_01850 [Acidimicrobiales bacterium]
MSSTGPQGLSAIQLPFLSDNGLIFTTQGRHDVAGVTEQELFSLGIEAKHSRP